MSEAELLDLRTLRRTQREQVFAGRQQSGGARGTSFARDLPTLQAINEDLAEIDKALRRLNPDKYGSPRRVLRATFS